MAGRKSIRADRTEKPQTAKDGTEPLPIKLAPMLATAGELPIGDGWIYETKWDGIRAVVSIDGEGFMRIHTRAGNDVTHQFPELVGLPEAVHGHAVVIDGEIMAFGDDGLPSFHKLQHRLGLLGIAAIETARHIPVLFTMFDLLHLDGFSTRSLPFSNRRKLLEKIDIIAGPHWHLTQQHADGELLAEVTRAAGIEGVVAKRLDSTYSVGTRSRAWIKKRHLNHDQFVIGGWVPGEGRRQSTIGALLIGARVDDDSDVLQWVGKVGTGFTDAELAKLLGLLEPLRQAKSPFDSDVGEPTCVFVKPVHVANVAYGEYSPEGLLRFPSYKGLHEPPSS
jgi:bifunctional non-homologous end joining protein LigD